MRVGYDNKTMTETLTASSVAPGYPVTNLQDSRMTRQWRSFTGGTWTIDVDGLINASMACVNAHNVVTGDTIKLLGYSDAGRTTLVTTVTFDIIEYATAKVFTEQSLYWTFEFSVASQVAVGGLFLGTDLILPSYEIGHNWTQVAGDTFSVSPTRQLYGLNIFQYRKASYLIPTVTWDQQSDDISKWFKAVGISSPFYLLQYPDRQDLRLLFYCRLVDTEMEWQEHEKNITVYKDLPINIEEVF